MITQALVNKLHICFEVCIHTVDLCERLVELVAEYLYLVELLLQYVYLEAVEIAAFCVTDLVEQEVLAYNEHIKADIVFAADLRADKNIIYNVVGIYSKNGLCHCLLCCECSSAVYNSNVCAVFLVEINYRSVVDICHYICI